MKSVFYPLILFLFKNAFIFYRYNNNNYFSRFFPKYYTRAFCLYEAIIDILRFKQKTHSP